MSSEASTSQDAQPVEQPANQATLSEQLLLLRELDTARLEPGAAAAASDDLLDYYAELCARRGKKDARTLGTLAVALSTGLPGDTFAVALADADDTASPHLVLAKNGPVSDADRAAAHELLALASAAAAGAPSWEHELYSYLARRCAAALQRTVAALAAAAAGPALDGDVAAVLRTYTPHADARLEFPGASGAQFLAQLPADRLAIPALDAFPALLRDALDALRRAAAAAADDTGAPRSASHLRLLAAPADVLRRSRLLTSVAHDFWWAMRAPDAQARLGALKRRLDAVCFWAAGVRDALQAVREFFPGATAEIPHVWVPDEAFAARPVELGSPDIRAALARALPRHDAAAVQDALRATAPRAADAWAAAVAALAPRVHAALRVVLHCAPPPAPRNTYVLPRRRIGLSAPGCYCCRVWLAAFNDACGTAWRAGASCGRADPGWALPTAAGGELEGVRAADAEVVRRVEAKVGRALVELVVEAGGVVEEPPVRYRVQPIDWDRVRVEQKARMGRAVDRGWAAC